jgi:hypothetical protein
VEWLKMKALSSNFRIERKKKNPAWANSLGDPILKKPITHTTHTKGRGGWWSGPEFKPQNNNNNKRVG